MSLEKAYKALNDWKQSVTVEQFIADNKRLNSNVNLNSPNISEIIGSNEMKSLIFLDDERWFPDVTWIDYKQEFKDVFICRNYVDFTCVYDNDFKDIFVPGFDLKNYAFSFDHDIASFDENGYERTGLTCAKWLCEYIMDNNLDPKDLEYYVHSQNPVGAQNITEYIENFKRSWSPE